MGNQAERLALRAAIELVRKAHFATTNRWEINARSKQLAIIRYLQRRLWEIIP